MSGRAATIEAVVEGLAAEGLLPDAQAGEAEVLLERLAAAQPWYIRAMVGFGAWLASLLLISFVAGFGLALGGSVVIGLGLLAGATWVRRKSQFEDNDFVVQCTLATSLAGQALFGWGLADLLPGDEIETGCLVVLMMSAILFFVFPDRIHRVLMVLFAATALVTLAYAFELNGAVPVIGPLLAAALVWLYQRRAAVTASGRGEYVRPLATGLMLAAFGCLLLSTIYVLPELGSDFLFYPRPWISTLLLGALLFYVVHAAWQALWAGRAAAAVAVHVLVLAIIAAAWFAPGLLLALIVILLGAAAGHRTFVGAGIVFLIVFVGAYFYGIEITMLQKSITLVTAGIVILSARWLLGRLLGAKSDA